MNRHLYIKIPHHAKLEVSSPDSVIENALFTFSTPELFNMRASFGKQEEKKIQKSRLPEKQAKLLYLIIRRHNFLNSAVVLIYRQQL